MERPYWTRIALLGIGVYLFIELVILVATLVIGPRDQVWYPCLVGGIVLVFGALIYFVRPWGLIPGILGGLVGIPFTLDSLSSNLSSPDSFFDFAYRPFFWPVGTVFVLVGCVMGLVQHFRHRESDGGPRLFNRAAVGLLAALALVAVYSAIWTIAGIDRVSAADKQGAIILTARDWEYSLDTIHASSTGTTRIVVKNTDGIIHTFTIAALGINVKLGPWDEKVVDIVAPQPGSYLFRCTVPAARQDARHARSGVSLKRSAVSGSGGCTPDRASTLGVERR